MPTAAASAMSRMPDKPGAPTEDGEAVPRGSKLAGWVLTVLLLIFAAGLAYVGLTATQRIASPDVVGMTQTQAVAEIEKAGLVAKVEYADSAQGVVPDTVVAQDPQARVGVRPGGTVTLAVAATH